jgi:hypothetical protein
MKATDHELQKYDNFTRYGHPRSVDDVFVLEMKDLATTNPGAEIICR